MREEGVYQIDLILYVPNVLHRATLQKKSIIWQK